ncbi:hypothetical protein BDN70DRAFT_112564 [Pholiota conissans]|uniref:Uncharacterized protein n=1 Tax=Pholiota conissans TaxID=109636 RepID=A0A9P5YY79_9AGAR|nr:hypothetical protein BDN70DRAFT_112564 [Pholiota conissans]
MWMGVPAVGVYDAAVYSWTDISYVYVTCKRSVDLGGRLGCAAIERSRSGILAPYVSSNSPGPPFFVGMEQYRSYRNTDLSRPTLT